MGLPWRIRRPAQRETDRERHMRDIQVLVVDDELGMRELLTTYLREFGITPITASNGVQALDLIESQPVDLVITDLWMPEMDGLELLQRVKAHNSRIPVAVLSGHGTVQDTVRALNLGAYTFLSKPVRIEDIGAAVKKGLRLRDLSVGTNELQNYVRHYSELRIPNYPHLFASVILYVLKDCQWRGFDDDQMLSNLSVVLDEMLMNAYVHGNKEKEDRSVLLRYSFDVDRFQITIEDEGEGFDTKRVIQELTSLERHQLLERGLFLLSILTDEFRYNEQGNAVTFSFLRPLEDSSVVEVSGEDMAE
jgi:DNA-binding response OmpR family regulator